jgi:hypothetical protein
MAASRAGRSRRPEERAGNAGDTWFLSDPLGTLVSNRSSSEWEESMVADGNDGRRTAAKDPKDWVTGGEPMTGPQESYLGTLARESGADVPADLTKAEASGKIEELQGRTGRG